MKHPYIVYRVKNNEPQITHCDSAVAAFEHAGMFGGTVYEPLGLSAAKKVIAEDPITEQWLRDVGFKWEMTERQPEKHWILWMGGAVATRTAYSSEDLGIELSHSYDDLWHCWIRGDLCGRYSRFLHIRYLKQRHEVETLIEAMTGFPFEVANAMYGSYHKPEHAARLREDYAKRLDVQIAEEWGKRAMRETGQDESGRDKVKP